VAPWYTGRICWIPSLVSENVTTTIGTLLHQPSIHRGLVISLQNLSSLCHHTDANYTTLIKFEGFCNNTECSPRYKYIELLNDWWYMNKDASIRLWFGVSKPFLENTVIPSEHTSCGKWTYNKCIVDVNHGHLRLVLEIPLFGKSVSVHLMTVKAKDNSQFRPLGVQRCRHWTLDETH